MANFPGAGEVLASIRAATVCHFALIYTDVAATYTIPIPAGTFLHAGGTFTSQAFTTSGNAATLLLQSHGGTHDLMDTTDCDIGVIDTVFTTIAGAGESAATGKYFPTDTTIDFVFVPASAGATAGKVVGWLKFSNVKLDGIAAAAAA